MRKGMPAGSRKDLAQVLQYYDDFEGPVARRKFVRGGFEEFVAFVEGREKDDERRSRLVELARAWRLRYVSEELGARRC